MTLRRPQATSLEAQLDEALLLLDSLVEVGQREHRRLVAMTAAVKSAYAFADELEGYCSPHGVSAMYAGRLRERLDAATGWTDGREPTWTP